jgi:hypothetical protein
LEFWGVTDIVYKPWTTAKAQALCNFVAEWTEAQACPWERELEYWTINFDGPLQLQGARAEILVTSSKGKISNISCKCFFQHLTMQPSMKLYFMV